MRVESSAASAAALRDRLRHVYWLGGGSGAGKSTVANRIAATHGMHRYATDEVMADHAGRSTPERCPYLHQFMGMDFDQRWVRRSPQVMLETFHWYRGEGFDLIVEDLLALPTEPNVLVEGFRLLPHLVHPLLGEPGRAVWLLPTPGFRRAAFEHRGGLWTIAGRTSDPQRALDNLLERDRLFTDRLRAETAGLELPTVEVDTMVSEDSLAELVTRALGL